MHSPDSTVLKSPAGDLIIAQKEVPFNLAANSSIPVSAPSPINPSPSPSPDPNINVLPPGEEIDIIDAEAYAIAVYCSHKDPSDYLQRFHQCLSAHLHPDIFPSEEVYT